MSSPLLLALALATVADAGLVSWSKCKREFKYAGVTYYGATDWERLWAKNPWCYLKAGGWDYVDPRTIPTFYTKKGQECEPMYKYWSSKVYGCSNRNHKGYPWCYIKGTNKKEWGECKPYVPTPTNVPTMPPTGVPTAKPTSLPTVMPTVKPTVSPTTRMPTHLPTPTPTRKPTLQPTHAPTRVPTNTPTHLPTEWQVKCSNVRNMEMCKELGHCKVKGKRTQKCVYQVCKKIKKSAATCQATPKCRPVYEDGVFSMCAKGKNKGF